MLHTVSMGMPGGSIGTLARAAVARSWPGLVGLVMVVALGGGAVIGAFAAAVRTSTAHDRMIVATDAYDVLVNPDNGTSSALDPAAVAHLPQVADIGRVDGFALVDARTGEPPPITLISDGSAMLRLGRPKLLSGRLPDPSKGDEVFAEAHWARRAGVKVGDVIPAASVSAAEFGVVGDLVAGDRAAIREAVRAGRLGPITNLRVVGIGIEFDEVVSNEGEEGLSLLLRPPTRPSTGRRWTSCPSSTASRSGCAPRTTYLRSVMPSMPWSRAKPSPTGPSRPCATPTACWSRRIISPSPPAATWSRRRPATNSCRSSGSRCEMRLRSPRMSRPPEAKKISRLMEKR